VRSKLAKFLRYLHIEKGISQGTIKAHQLEACLNYCLDKDYEVAYRFSETYSGLTLDRPKLNELRELVRNEQIDVLVVYCLDKLSPLLSAKLWRG